MKKVLCSCSYSVLLAFFVFAGFTAFSQAPIINTFSPSSGPAGTVITITGNNFSPSVSSNAVYFGGLRAVVSVAGSSSVTVTVPAGAGSAPISVTNLITGLTGYSAVPFSVKLPGADNYFDANSFGNARYFGIPGSYISALAVGDIDGDGKQDIVTRAGILQNTSTKTNINFSTVIPVLFGLGSDLNNIRLADFNGDGMLDIATVSEKVSIYKNTSTPGNISFSAGVDFTENFVSFKNLEIDDFDKDGRPDIVAAADTFGSVRVYAFKNNSTLSTIQIDNVAKYPINTPLTIMSLEVGDIDQDSRPDICVTAYSDSFFILRNISGSNNISFASPRSFYIAESFCRDMSIADMDGDKVPDVCLLNTPGNDHEIIFFKNKSKPNEIAFEVLQYYPDFNNIGSMTTADLNGDGRNDVIYGSFDGFQLLYNNSSPCNSSLMYKTRVATPQREFAQAKDLNGDGKPELICGYSTSDAVHIFENKIKQTIKGCAAGSSAIASNITGSVFQWQQNTGSGFVNISDNGIISGASTSVLHITNPSTAWNGYSYRCISDVDTGNIFIHSVNDVITPSLIIRSCPALFCSGDSTVFTAVTTEEGLNPLYQWQDSNSVAGWRDIAGAVLPELKYATTIIGTKIRCKMTPGFSCSPGIVTSGIVSLDFTCTSNVIVCPNGNVTVTSNLSGSFYQWSVDKGTGFTSISNDATYAGVRTASLQIRNMPSSAYGYKYRCLTSNGYSNIFRLKFSNTWTGAVSSIWENPANWSCNIVPDAGTDVVISSGTVILNSNTTIRSLTLSPTATLTISTGKILTVTH